MLRQYMPQLVPVLLTNMAYEPDDEARARRAERRDWAHCVRAQDVIEAEADELSGDKPDREQDLKPFMHSSKARDLRRFSSRCSTDSVFAQTALSGEGDEEEEGGDEDDGIRSWTLRQSSASSLDVLSNCFPADLLPVLLPIVDVRASRTHRRRPASHTLPSSGEAARRQLASPRVRHLGARRRSGGLRRGARPPGAADHPGLAARAGRRSTAGESTLCGVPPVPPG